MNPQESLIRSIHALSGDLRAHGVKDLWLFGSAARGEPNAHDLDFLVEFVTPPTLTGFMNLKFFLEERLQIHIDLHSRAACPERFFKRIQPDLLHVA
ncbi:MAG: nucleotidyltransferase family protein [Verrucomicrobiota bacterium]